MNIQYYSGVLASVIRGITLAFKTYKNRVLADLGIVTSDSNTIAYMKMSKQQSIDKSIQFAWFGEAGSTIRTSGIYSYFTKLYSLLTTNDATQTTSTYQPFVGGNIAPNEKLCLKNPNGGGNYMTHPTISFGATDSWSVSTVLNYNQQNTNNSQIIGDINSIDKSTIRVGLGNDSIIGFRNAIGDINDGIFNIGKFVGKNTIYTFIADGTSKLLLYINGIYINTTTIQTSITFNAFLNYNNSRKFSGSISSHIIRAQALTPQQVLAEATYLKSLYPDIPSVTIGSQVWSTSNCEMVCTPQGNSIPEMQPNVNVEKVVNGGFDDASNWVIGTGWSVSGGLLNGNGAMTSQTRQGLLGMQTSNKFYKLTYTISNYVSGYAIFSFGSNINCTSRNSNGTFIEYINTTGANNSNLYISHIGLFVGSIDNISAQEIGWSGSQELYDGIYAQTTGTTEVKTYSALKAASMWCHYNNDSTVGSVYGKLYNWFAVKLLQMDIDYYNVANPTSLWGYRVPTQADYTALSTYLGGDIISGGKMKIIGFNYWNSPNTGSDNTSGFSAIGGGYRLSNGNFGGSLIQTRFWGLDTFRLAVDNASTVSDISSGILLHGVSLRMIKN